MDGCNGEFSPPFLVTILLDRACVKENHVALISEVYKLISENSTKRDIIIYTESVDRNLRGVGFYSSVWRGNNQRGLWGVCCNYKQHGHGDHGSDEGAGMAGGSECHPGLRYNEHGEGSELVCVNRGWSVYEAQDCNV